MLHLLDGLVAVSKNLIMGLISTTADTRVEDRFPGESEPIVGLSVQDFTGFGHSTGTTSLKSLRIRTRILF